MKTINNIATVKLTSLSPYISSVKHETPPIDDSETPDAYERRTYMDKMRFSERGTAIIPAMAFKYALDYVASHVGMKVKGRGMKTYATAFKVGILISDPVDTGVKKEDVKCQRIYCHINGQKKSNSGRVWRLFPMISTWSGNLVVRIYDPTITKDVFQDHIEAAGVFCGVGSFSARSGNQCGRFAAKIVKYE